MKIPALQHTVHRVYHNTQVRQLVSKFRTFSDRGQSTPSSLDRSPALLFPPLQVVRVDDPYGDMSLVVVRGDVQHDTVEDLQTVLADLPVGHFVHLDLGNASIRSGWAMRLLEASADDLEGRGVVLRVVGLDPQHPMLTATL